MRASHVVGAVTMNATSARFVPSRSPTLRIVASAAVESWDRTRRCDDL